MHQAFKKYHDVSFPATLPFTFQCLTPRNTLLSVYLFPLDLSLNYRGEGGGGIMYSLDRNMIFCTYFTFQARAILCSIDNILVWFHFKFVPCDLILPPDGAHAHPALTSTHHPSGTHPASCLTCALSSLTLCSLTNSTPQ